MPLTIAVYKRDFDLKHFFFSFKRLTIDIVYNKNHKKQTVELSGVIRVVGTSHPPIQAAAVTLLLPETWKGLFDYLGVSPEDCWSY